MTEQAQDAAGAIVYEGLTSVELAAALNVEQTIDDLPAYQQENGQLSAAARERLPGVRDIAYGPDASQKLDIFAPDGAGLPVLVDIHGGGWRAGSKDSRSMLAETITGAGIIWVPIDYGLAPDFNITQIIDHARSAVAWVYQNIAEYGGDPERLYVSGNSAGGHLTGTVLMPGWHGNYGVPEGLVKGACAMSGVFDLQALYFADGSFNDQLGMDQETAKANSPLFDLPGNGCPLILSYGAPELGEFIRQSQAYAEAWRKAGHSVTEIAVDGAHHFAMSRELDNADGDLHKAVVAMVTGGG